MTTQMHNYFSPTILNNMDAFVRRARKALKTAPDFDTFVVRGNSGVLAGGILARSLKKNLYVVRKDDDGSHDSNKAFGVMGERWLFLDDFISSGRTFWNTYDRVREVLGWDWETDPVTSEWVKVPRPVSPCVGAYLYARENQMFGVDQFEQHLNNYGAYIQDLQNRKIERMS